LGIDHVIHAGHHQRADRRWLFARHVAGEQPHLVFDLRRGGGDFGKLVGVAGAVVEQPLIQVARKQRLDARRIGPFDQVGAQVFGADRVGLFLFQVLALVVAADRHRQREADQQRQQRQCCTLHEVEVLACIGGDRLAATQHQRAERRGGGQQHQHDEKQHRRMADQLTHGDMGGGNSVNRSAFGEVAEVNLSSAAILDISISDCLPIIAVSV